MKSLIIIIAIVFALPSVTTSAQKKKKINTPVISTGLIEDASPCDPVIAPWGSSILDVTEAVVAKGAVKIVLDTMGAIGDSTRDVWLKFEDEWYEYTAIFDKRMNYKGLMMTYGYKRTLDASSHFRNTALNASMNYEQDVSEESKKSRERRFLHKCMKSTIVFVIRFKADDELYSFWLSSPNE